jgi:hypothetical protein
MADEERLPDSDHRVDDIARVRSSKQTRRALGATAAAAAVVAIGVGAFVIDRGGGDESVVTDSGPSTVVTEPTSSEPSTSEPTTTASTVLSTTTPPAPGWQRATDPPPGLAYLPCCGTDWEGEPSPAIPEDPAAPLVPGVYNLRAPGDEEPIPYLVDGVLTLDVRPYVRCAELPEFGCSGEPPYRDDELGVPRQVGRTVEWMLDDEVKVRIEGYVCAADEIGLDPWIGAGGDLAALFAELDAAYESSIAAPLRSGVAPADVLEQLIADPASGFFAVDCPSYTSLVWRPSSGPPILVPLVLDLPAEMPAPDPIPSAATAWIHPTALVVDAQGVETLHFYAGFLS